MKKMLFFDKIPHSTKKEIEQSIKNCALVQQLQIGAY
jgi:hypothetical protein